jgi:hypothetical protein
MGALADLRGRVAGVLAPGPGDDWTVHSLPVDSLQPPAFLLVWSDLWLAPATHCTYTARLDVVAVSNRVDVEPGVETLESLVEQAFTRLAAGGLPAVQASRPGPYTVAGLTFLSSRLTLNHPVQL